MVVLCVAIVIHQFLLHLWGGELVVKLRLTTKQMQKKLLFKESQTILFKSFEFQLTWPWTLFLTLLTGLWWAGVQLCWWVKFKFNCIVERSGGKQSKEHSTLVRPWLWWWPLWSTVLTFQHWAVPCPLLHTAPQPINQNYFRQNSGSVLMSQSDLMTVDSWLTNVNWFRSEHWLSTPRVPPQHSLEK